MEQYNVTWLEGQTEVVQCDKAVIKDTYIAFYNNVQMSTIIESPEDNLALQRVIPFHQIKEVTVG